MVKLHDFHFVLTSDDSWLPKYANFLPAQNLQGGPDFPSECVGETVLKIGQYLATMWSKV